MTRLSMNALWRLQWICVGVALTAGGLSWLSTQFGGLGHVPRINELPGIYLTSKLDRVPVFLEGSMMWPTTYLNRLEAALDNYQCLGQHKYQVRIVNHAPLILHLQGFLPVGESTHFLKLAYMVMRHESDNTEWHGKMILRGIILHIGPKMIRVGLILSRMKILSLNV